MIVRPWAWLLVTAGLSVPPAHAQSSSTSPEAAEATGPRLALRGFSNVDFAVHEEGLADTFALGQFDTFMTSALSDEVTVLAEIVFEFGEDNTAVLDVERVQIKWAPSDQFSLMAGRMHTPLGYWNQTFHHGAWFQTTAGRPEMYLFEDDGGILPVHEVGLQAAGTWPTEAVYLKYSVSVVNGRGRIPDEIFNVQDASDGKAVNLLVGLAPAAVPGLELGFNTYLDTIPPGETGDSIRERILGGYLVYLRHGVELLAEASHVRHRVGGAEFGTWGLYAQSAWKHGRWKPYYRFDRVDVADGDPFLPAKEVSLHTLGLRVDALAWAALKGEYHLARPAGAEDIHSARLQVAFTF